MFNNQFIDDDNDDNHYAMIEHYIKRGRGDGEKDMSKIIVIVVVIACVCGKKGSHIHKVSCLILFRSLGQPAGTHRAFLSFQNNISINVA